MRYHKGARPSAAVTAVVAVPAVAEGPITAATRSKLAAVNRLDHFAGVKALAAAAEMDRGGHLGSAWASLSKEHTALMVAALDGVAVAADPMDELKAWRDRRNAG